MPSQEDWALLGYIAADIFAPGMHSFARRNLSQMADDSSSDAAGCNSACDLNSELLPIIKSRDATGFCIC